MRTRSRSDKSAIHIMITILVMVFIFVQSAMPGEVSGAESGIVVRFLSWIAGSLGISNINTDAFSFFIRKVAHFTEYMILGCCLYINLRDRAARKTAGNSRHPADVATFRLCVYAWVFGALYAATDEFHQRFVPERSGEIRDVCIDAAGVAAGVLITWLIMRYKDQSDRDRSAD